MPEDITQKSSLDWVAEPVIENGRVVYTYRNPGGLAADTVVETVTVFHGDTNSVQSFQLGTFASGQRQETHAPVGHDVPDGEVEVWVHVQAARTGEADWDATIDARVQGHAQGGILRAGAPAAGGADAAKPLHLDLSHPTIDTDDFVVVYRIDGGRDVAGVSCSVSLVDPAGHARWTGSESMPNQRDGVLRVGVPFDLVDGDGWRLELSAGAFADDGSESRAEVQMQLAFTDGAVGDGGHSVTTSA